MKKTSHRAARHQTGAAPTPPAHTRKVLARKALARKALALRYVWWQSAEETLAAPETLLRQILRIGTADDYVAACSHWGESAMKRALASAPAGSLDERSWVFWHRHYGLPARAFPRRTFR